MGNNTSNEVGSLILITCDSLRYDFAKNHLDGIFEEQTFSKIHTLDTRTALNLPTMFTGLPKEEHKSLHPWEPVQYEDCLFDHLNSWCTVSRYLGWSRDHEVVSRELEPHAYTRMNDQPHMYHPLDFRPVSMNDNDIFEFVNRNEKTKEWQLINYWSWITHYPYGIANLAHRTCPAIMHEEKLLHRLDKEKRDMWYTQGVLEMKDRIRSIRNMTDDVIVVTSDHGEALGEDGIFGHPRLGMGGKLYPPLAEVPFIINRTCDNIPKEFKQTEFKDIVIKLLEEYNEI